MQLVRVIQHGMDVDGDHLPDLDESQIFYFGFSMGGIQGASLLAVDPTIAAGVLNSPGAGGDLTIAALSPLPVGRPTLGALLAARVPWLLNAQDLTSGGVAVAHPTSTRTCRWGTRSDPHQTVFRIEEELRVEVLQTSTLGKRRTCKASAIRCLRLQDRRRRP